MIIDLNTYRRSTKPQVELWCNAKGGNPKDHIKDIALASSCPIICVAYYTGEIYGFTPELDKYIQGLVDFYKITEVRGKL